jgi:uncharacterized protein (TIGR04255 family)
MQERFPQNPLQQVALEIRFPPDLTILSSVLPPFQKRIRHRYPQYTSEQVITLPAGTTSSVAAFRSADGERQLKLSEQHLAIIFSRYTSFENFQLEALDIIGILDELAELSTLQRVGMRYINNIEVRETDENVADLVRPFIDTSRLPPGDVQQFISTVSLSRGGYGINLTTAQLPPSGLAQRPHGAGQPRAIYVLDIDVFTEQPKAVGDLVELLPTFRRESKTIFLTHVTEAYKRRMRGVE